MILDGVSKIGILGFGREGLSVYDFLRRDYSDLEIHVFDKRTEDTFAEDLLEEFENAGVVLHLGEDYLSELNQVQMLVKSPGVNPRQPEIVRFLGLGGSYTTATNLFFERVSGKVIGITGSKGKSTTSTLIYQCLTASDHQVFLVGNIGEPILNYLEFDSPEVFFVVEMSSQQLEDFEGRVDYALFTSFFADHMDYHGGMEAYVDAKVNLFRNAKLTIYNGDDEVVTQILKSRGVLARSCQKYGFKFRVLTDSDYSNSDCAIFLNDIPYLSSKEVKLLGSHNLKNMMLVSALGLELGLDKHVLQNVFYKFTGLQHRMELFSVNNFHVVNDSSSVTPESTLACLKAFSNYDRKILILGGMDRGYDYSILNDALTDEDQIVVMPNLRDKITLQLGVNGVYLVDDLDSAVSKAVELLDEGDLLVFSPGAPSYNMFKNFYERGDEFLKTIKAL